LPRNLRAEAIRSLPLLVPLAQEAAKVLLLLTRQVQEAVKVLLLTQQAQEVVDRPEAAAGHLEEELEAQGAVAAEGAAAVERTFRSSVGRISQARCRVSWRRWVSSIKERVPIATSRIVPPTKRGQSRLRAE
jgi:hypothetical protein